MAKVIVKEETPQPQKLTDATILGKFIRAARTNSSLTIHDTAAICGVSVSTMTKIENAKGDMKLSTVLKVCKMLGITLRIEA
ncbi:helix-turn-helix domain-containing protein [Limisalsivibrio acetivorans]|uniref:helix-turn-helix domain-containing protein n=1 Tax=Limisalsivibrio acetivorans TaxID=1304888 RepID=UPI0003B6A9FD|nr:helix-turn-helix domain-containing protein [Limisalsivibrio acetivorans]